MNLNEQEWMVGLVHGKAIMFMYLRDNMYICDNYGIEIVKTELTFNEAWDLSQELNRVQPDIKPGDIVRHKTYGIGIVTEADKHIAIVNFDNSIEIPFLLELEVIK
jgi:hypothetical protein